jgi:hypothetical protein
MPEYTRMLFALGLIATSVPAVAAQERPHFGPRLSYHLDYEAVGLGAQLGLPIARHLEFYPSGDVFFRDDDTRWSVNADLKYRVAATTVPWLYMGTGLNIAQRGGSSSSGAGLNLFLGMESRTGRVHPFVEFRYTSNDGSTAQLAAGINFTLAR